jgi:hypothetical protein
MHIDKIPPIENQNKKFNIALFKEKLFASWGSARDQFGVPNNHRLSKILYKSLYAPNTFKTSEIINNKKFVGRTEILTSKLPIDSENIPNLEEFSAVIVRALTSDIDSSKHLYPEALKTVKKMTTYGPVRIWTKGDVYGIGGQPGSAEQIKKVATAGLGKLRNNIALKNGGDRHNVLNVKAAEDKIPFIQEILREFKNKKIEIAILLDDQINNIEQAIKEATNVPDIHLYSIWINKKNSEHKNDIKIINNIHSVLPEIANLLSENKVGFIVDFDGVLVDDDKRMEAQFKSVYNKLKENKWL